MSSSDLDLSFTANINISARAMALLIDAADMAHDSDPENLDPDVIPFLANAKEDACTLSVLHPALPKAIAALERASECLMDAGSPAEGEDASDEEVESFLAGEAMEELALRLKKVLKQIRNAAHEAL